MSMSETDRQPTETVEAVAIKLEPPTPVPVVAPAQAAGLVAISDEQRTALDERVDGFVNDLINADANSPESGQKVDQITNMGRQEIPAACRPTAFSTAPCAQWTVKARWART